MHARSYARRIFIPCVFAREEFQAVLQNQKKCVRASQSILQNLHLDPQNSRSILEMHQGLITIKSPPCVLRMLTPPFREMFQSEIRLKHEIQKHLRYDLPIDAESLKHLFIRNSLLILLSKNFFYRSSPCR